MTGSSFMAGGYGGGPVAAEVPVKKSRWKSASRRAWVRAREARPEVKAYHRAQAAAYTRAQAARTREFRRRVRGWSGREFREQVILRALNNFWWGMTWGRAWQEASETLGQLRGIS